MIMQSVSLHFHIAFGEPNFQSSPLYAPFRADPRHCTAWVQKSNAQAAQCFSVLGWLYTHGYAIKPNMHLRLSAPRPNIKLQWLAQLLLRNQRNIVWKQSHQPVPFCLRVKCNAIWPGMLIGLIHFQGSSQGQYFPSPSNCYLVKVTSVLGPALTTWHPWLKSKVESLFPRSLFCNGIVNL